MDNEEAKFLLAACQPSGRDAHRPEIAEALAQAARDPELAAWLERERRSDRAIAAKLRQLEPQAGLRARVLAGGRASRRARTWRTWRTGFGLAAAVTLAAGLGWWGHALIFPAVHVPAEGVAPLLSWQKNAVGVFSNPFFRLDLERNTYEPLEAHLVAAQAPTAGELPFSDAIVAAVGCKLLQWRNDTVSLTCFRSDTGELVHLFVGARGDIDESLLAHGPHREQVGAFATITWTQGDRIVMVASKLPAAELERAVVRARLAWANDRIATPKA